MTEKKHTEDLPKRKEMKQPLRAYSNDQECAMEDENLHDLVLQFKPAHQNDFATLANTFNVAKDERKEETKAIKNVDFRSMTPQKIRNLLSNSNSGF